MPSKSTGLRFSTALLGLIILFGFALRLWNLGTQSLWHDEAWSIFSSYHPLAWGAQGTDPNTPPLFYITLSAWMHLVGDGVWLLRFWSVTFGVLIIALTTRLVWRWFGKPAALISAAFVAVSPLLWVYSQEIRAYIAVPIFALILLLLLDRFLRSPDRTLLVAILATELLALYTHNLAVALVAWLNALVIVAWGIRRAWRKVGVWLASQCGIALAYLPWLLTQRPTGSALNTVPALTPMVVWDVWQSYFTGEAALLNSDPILLILISVLGVTAIASLIAALWWRRSARLYLLISQALLVPVAELAIIWGAHIDFHPRYFIAGVPAILVVIAVGMEAFNRQVFIASHAKVLRPLAFAWRHTFLAIAALMVIGTGYEALRQTEGNPIYQHDDFRAIATYYARLPAHDAIVIPYGWEPTLAYYASKIGIRAQIVGIPLDTSWQTIAEHLNALHAEHVEVLTWYQSPADLRGIYPCLLGAVTTQPPSTYTVVGLTTTGYDHPGHIEAQPLPSQSISFGLFASTDTTIITGTRRVCVMSGWKLIDKDAVGHQEPYRASIGLQNPQGWLFTRGDSDLRDNHQVSSLFWPLGQSGKSYILLNYPTGTPPGLYPLMLSLYGAQSLHGLDVMKGKTPVGQVVQIGTLAIPRSEADITELDAFHFITVSTSVSISLITPSGSSRCILQPGQTFRVTALWRKTAEPAQSAILRLRGSGWQAEQQATLGARSKVGRVQLAWYTLTIPAHAQGQAILEAVEPGSEGTRKLLACTVTTSSHLYTEPVMQHSLGETFAGIGSLVGYDLPITDIHTGTPITVTLYWRAQGIPAMNDTVFTHLLDSSGHVIAQDDEVPANGQRPTTGWLQNEYIVDPHVLRFNTQGQGYRGPATIEVGLYDPITGVRAQLADGSDHFLLPVDLVVK